MAKLFRVILPVSDLDRASACYSELLAMPGERVSPGRHYFNCEGTILACYHAGADGDVPADPPRWAAGQYYYFSVPDLERTHDCAVRLGFIVEPGGIQKMPWGERIFWSADPFGNPVAFVAEETVYWGGEFPDSDRPE